MSDQLVDVIDREGDDPNGHPMTALAVRVGAFAGRGVYIECGAEMTRYVFVIVEVPAIVHDKWQIAVLSPVSAAFALPALRGYHPGYLTGKVREPFTAHALVAVLDRAADLFDLGEDQ